MTPPDSLIDALVANLAVHRADTPAIWEGLPRVYQEVTGEVLDKLNPRHVMICQCVVQRLSDIPTSC